MKGKVWFYPNGLYKTAKLRLIVRRLGLQVGTREDHDLRVYFSHRTIDRDGVILDKRGRRRGETTQVLPNSINGGCTDVSKSRVEKVFRQVFGYGSFIDPRKSDVVQKTEVQAIKDILHRKPCAPRGGYVNQRFIDTRRGGLFVDLRPAVFDGRIHTVIVKRKAKFLRGAGAHMSFVDPRSVFTKEEIALILDFSKAFGLDCGEIDALRDNETDKLYLIDVNPTTNSDVDYVGMENQLGPMARELVEEHYAEAFLEAFWNDKWRV